MPKIKAIYIIGFMGSGKTTTGKKLAAAMDWSFIDLDKKIEENTGMTIPEIFTEKGEDYFRILEAEQLRNLQFQPYTVISTGGGTPCNGDNMDYMVETGLTLYLKMTPEQLRSRLENSKGERPLIKNLQQSELIDFIEKKLAFREKWYNRAEIIVEGIDLNINKLHSLVESIINT